MSAIAPFEFINRKCHKGSICMAICPDDDEVISIIVSNFDNDSFCHMFMDEDDLRLTMDAFHRALHALQGVL